MTWHHKVVMNKAEHYGDVHTQYRIAEYYPDLGAWTENPVAPAEESLVDLVWSLEKMLEAAKAALADESLVIDEFEYEQIKQGLKEADEGKFASQGGVEELRLKWTKEDVAHILEVCDNPSEPYRSVEVREAAFESNDEGYGAPLTEEQLKAIRAASIATSTPDENFIHKLF